MKHHLKILSISLVAAFAMLAAAAAQDTPPPSAKAQAEDFRQNNLIVASAKYLGATAESMAEIVDGLSDRYGEPDAVIRGSETGLAVALGVRYGYGTLHMRSGETYPIYWRGPSLGLDFGLNVTKSFILIYNIDSHEDLYRRFGGFDGELFVLGGVAISRLRRGDTVVAPMRAGIGVRAGINIGHMKFSPNVGWFGWIPF